MADRASITEHLEALRAEVGEFDRGGWHSPDGDSLYFFDESTDQYRDRVDDVLTLYRAEDDHRIVGVQIKGVSKLPDHDGAAVMVETGHRGHYSVILLLFEKLKQKRTEPGYLDDSSRPYFEAMQAFSPFVAAAPSQDEGICV